MRVKQSAEQGDVRVDVRVAYHDQRALARATVCRLHKGGNRDGVGIFVGLFLFFFVFRFLLSLAYVIVSLDADARMVQPFS